jgi:septation ring formation regulator EzrA|tara:strand:+ start:290 stop:517 length:228 start_codon:yes stop_codon:yes gene_type:complete
MILQATSKELTDSIELLKTYRDRLKEEIITMSQKLRISQSTIAVNLTENIELKNIDKILKKLDDQMNQLSNENTV